MCDLLYDLTPYLVAQQADANSCWATAARSIINWFATLDPSGATPRFATDQALADAWNLVSPGQNHNDLTIQQSASAALADLGFVNSMDSHPLPTPAEIVAAINSGLPLLALVGTQPPPNGARNPAATGGHWVVITGISADAIDSTLKVFDPADGNLHLVPYDPATCAFPGEAPLYWQNTSYVDPLPDSANESAEDGLTGAPTNVVPLQSGLARRNASPLPGSTGSWSGTARGAIALTIQWTPIGDGAGINLTVNQTSGPGSPLTGTATLGGAPNAPMNCLLPFGDLTELIELTVKLVQNLSKQMRLLIDFPLSQDTAVHNKIIAKWQVASTSA